MQQAIASTLTDSTSTAASPVWWLCGGPVGRYSARHRLVLGVCGYVFGARGDCLGGSPGSGPCWFLQKYNHIQLMQAIDGHMRPQADNLMLVFSLSIQVRLCEHELVWIACFGRTWLAGRGQAETGSGRMSPIPFRLNTSIEVDHSQECSET
jgi:hypothetical protein